MLDYNELSSITTLREILADWRSTYYGGEGVSLKHSEGLLYKIDSFEGYFEVTFSLNHSFHGKLSYSFLVSDDGLNPRHVKASCWEAFHDILDQIAKRSPERKEDLTWCFPEIVNEMNCELDIPYPIDRSSWLAQDLEMYAELIIKIKELPSSDEWEIGPTGKGRRSGVR